MPAEPGSGVEFDATRMANCPGEHGVNRLERSVLARDVALSGCGRLKGGSALVAHEVGLFKLHLRNVRAGWDRHVAKEAVVVHAASPRQEPLLILLSMLRSPPHGFGLSLPVLRVLQGMMAPSSEVSLWVRKVRWYHAKLASPL